MNANGKREAEEEPWGQWRGERRSTRLGAPPDTQLDPEPRTKRARTEDSTMSTGSVDAPSTTSHGAKNGLKLKASGAAALKPNEVAMEQIAGKKRSKFWVYAVEPIPGAETAAPPDSDAMNGSASSPEMENGKRPNFREYTDEPTERGPVNGGASSAGDSGHSSDMEIDSPPPGPGNGRGPDGSASPLNST